MEVSVRKYNQIISCDKTPNGYWSVIVRTPHDQIHKKLYIGYAKSDVLRKARKTDFEKEAGLLFHKSRLER